MYEQCKMYLEKIPEPLNEDDVFEKYPTEYSECMNTVLMQEVVRYNALLAVSGCNPAHACLSDRG